MPASNMVIACNKGIKVIADMLLMVASNTAGICQNHITPTPVTQAVQLYLAIKAEKEATALCHLVGRPAGKAIVSKGPHTNSKITWDNMCALK